MSDHDRPLNDRGRQAAQDVGAALAARNLAPELIWSSDSKRTRETALNLIREIPGAQHVEYISGFYHAPMQDVLEICARRGEPSVPLMLLGHNPGWAELHQYFTGRADDYPTGACTVLRRTGDGHWLAHDSWTLIDFIKPRDIEAA